MAELRFIKLERDKKNCHYIAEIEFWGVKGRYHIFTPHFISWAPRLENYNILDRTSYEQINTGLLNIRVVGLDESSRTLAREVEKALIEKAVASEEPAEVL